MKIMAMDAKCSGRDKQHQSPGAVLQHQSDENWQTDNAQREMHMQYTNDNRAVPTGAN